MRRTLMFVVALTLFAAPLAAQQCRTYRGGVTICERGRDRDRDRDRDHRRMTHWRDRGPVEFGIRGGYDFEDDQYSAGAQFRIPLVRQLQIAPSADVYFGDEAAHWQLNADAIIKPDQLGGLYFGGGAAFLRREFDVLDGDETRVGYNVLLGLDGGRVYDTILRPFAEARWTGVGDDFNAFRLVAGINVPVSGLRR